MKYRNENEVYRIKIIYHSADIIHTIKNEENLFSIANMYNIDINDLILYNLQNCHNFLEMKEIKIPCSQELMIQTKD